MTARRDDHGPVHPVIQELALLRMHHGYSQAHVASSIGCSRTAVYGWETGRTSPHLSHLADYAELLGVELAIVEPEATP